LSRAWIRHSEIAAGGTVEFVMGAEPNKEWATRSEDLPPSGGPFAKSKIDYGNRLSEHAP
jgi:putative alpha-1,2-mannosidase